MSIELPSEAARVVHVNALTPIFEMPARGSRQAIGVLVAQIIGMGVSFEAEIVKPDRGAGVLIGESDRGAMDASLSCALSRHGQTVVTMVTNFSDAAETLGHPAPSMNE